LRVGFVKELLLVKQIKRVRSACIGRAATPYALTGAIPLLLAASTLSCWMSPLARIALLQTTWPPRRAPRVSMSRVRAIPLLLAASTLVRSLKLARVESTCLGHAWLSKIQSGEASRSLRYCNAKPTRDRTGASSRHSIPLQK
jgi:hypothetical protein